MDTRRPDEIYSEEKIRSARESDSRLRQGASAIAGIATAAGATGIASRVMPFLSKYIPSDLALKGINKVAPNIGKYLKKGMEKGLNIQDGLDFVKNGLNREESSIEAEAKKEISPKEKIWEMFNKGKTEASDPLISGFLKIAKSLKDYRGLKDQDQFSQLWDEFQVLRNEGKGLPQIMRELTQSHSKRVEQPNRNETQNSSGAMDKLVQALEAAANSRQRRQNNPM